MIAHIVMMAAAATSVGGVIADGAAGWNTGDLDRFMAGYAEDALYVTSKGVLKGKTAIAASYAPSFAKGGNTRGTLTFRTLAERPIGSRHRVLIARWTLTGPKVETGMTTLLFEKRGAQWLIVSDHSS